MSLRNNIFANYASQIYVTLIGFVMFPLYLNFMGAEAYGLVGFFAMLQAWFNLLDMGLTHTMLREAARFHGGATDALSYRRLVRALEGVFFVVALVGGGVMLAASGYIALEWLQAKQLPIDQVKLSVQLIAANVALRWICGLYRGAISGSEQLVWLGYYNSLIATLRYVGVLPILMFVGVTPVIFFSYQLGVALLEAAGLIIYTYYLLPITPERMRVPWSWSPLKPVLKFSLTIAFTSSLWVLVTQTDKLVLSKILPLAEYGYFTLAVLVSSVVGMLGGPIIGAIMPRMAKLEAEGDHTGLIRIYQQSTQVVAVIAGAISSTLVFCAEPLLWAWTGDQILAQQAGPVLTLYAIGNCILAVSAFPYYLQYAKGDLRLHWIGQIGFAILLVPAIIWAASKYSGVGGGYVWLVVNVIYFVTWVPLIHKRFEPGLNKSWFVRDVLLIFAAAAATGYALSIEMPQTDSRWLQGSFIAIMGFLVMLVSALASSVIRTRVCQWLSHRYMKKDF